MIQVVDNEAKAVQPQLLPEDVLQRGEVVNQLAPPDRQMRDPRQCFGMPRFRRKARLAEEGVALTVESQKERRATRRSINGVLATEV